MQCMPVVNKDIPCRCSASAHAALGLGGAPLSEAWIVPLPLTGTLSFLAPGNLFPCFGDNAAPPLSLTHVTLVGWGFSRGDL